MIPTNPQHKRISYSVFAKLALDIMVFLTAFLGSFLVRYPVERVGEPIVQIIPFIPVYLAVRLGCFAAFRLYKFIWRYTGIHALYNIIKATTLGSVIFVMILFFFRHETATRSILVVDWLLVIFFSGGIRMMVRKVTSEDGKVVKINKSKAKINILIYGAGDAGEQLLRNIETSPKMEINVVGFIDDDRNKKGKYIHNKRVMGNRSNIGKIRKKYSIDEIYFSIPSLSGSETRGALKEIRNQVEGEIVIKTIPDLSDLVSGKISVNQLREFEIKDLLRRKPVSLDVLPVEKMIEGKIVMVVGGGGSIGFELCRQIAAFNPEMLIILDSSEFNTYRAEDILIQEHPEMDVIPLVADVCNEIYMRKIFTHYKPNIVFHAAAYKHVPMMELNPWAAIQNNLSCTLVLTELCEDFKVDKFVLISTDKAVQPTSVMGATKRICELITLLRSRNGGVTKFMTVRFGNVLGSSGSVIHKFKEQISKGGPITVTHTEITRYFMLISEAVELVLQAGAIGKSGNVYVLDMGEPIRITELAKYMIELSGLKLNEDIKIEYSGLRPGEKLHESLLLVGKEKETKVPHLFVLEPSLNIGESYLKQIDNLLAMLYRLNHKELRENLRVLVPEYQPFKIDFKTFVDEKRFLVEYYVHSDSYPRVN